MPSLRAPIVTTKHLHKFDRVVTGIIPHQSLSLITIMIMLFWALTNEVFVTHRAFVLFVMMFERGWSNKSTLEAAPIDHQKFPFANY
jgi:hypothetical protein